MLKPPLARQRENVEAHLRRIVAASDGDPAELRRELDLGIDAARVAGYLLSPLRATSSERCARRSATKLAWRLHENSVKLDLRIDVQAALGRRSPCEIAATIHYAAPNGPPGAVIFAFPGSGYSRSYFDLHCPGHEDAYSQAQHHTDHGVMVVACDHFGVGDSAPEGDEPLTLEALASANSFAVTEIARRIESGSLAEHIPPLPGIFKIGAGQSMGGTILLLMQARHRSFDAVVMLGSSAIENVLPQPTAELAAATRAFYRALAANSMGVVSEIRPPPPTDIRYAFHWEDVPEDLVAQDLGAGYPQRTSVPPWGSASSPSRGIEVMSRGRVASAAASIDVPVLIALGERDIAAEPHAEPGAYPRSLDVSLVIVPRMAHMHNFASTRRMMWDRLIRWVDCVRPAGAVCTTTAGHLWQP